MNHGSDYNKAIKILKKHNIYYEKVFNGKHCYKYQPIGEPVIIIQMENKEEAAELMLLELQHRGVI